MSELDPEVENPVVPSDASSTDMSKSKLRAAWDAWTSRPENNAFLLQTGIALMQPRGPGQTALGAAANALGEGAAAADRNVGAQRAEADAEAARKVKQEEAAARTTTAGAYAQSVRDAASGRGKGSGLTTALRQQMEFNKWVRAPSDILAVDPVVQALQREFPDIKTKGDILANPAAKRRAFELFSSAGGGGEDEEGGGTGSPTTPSLGPPATSAPPSAPTAAPTPRIIYQKGTGKPFLWDGIPGHAPTPYNGPKPAP